MEYYTVPQTVVNIHKWYSSRNVLLYTTWLTKHSRPAPVAESAFSNNNAWPSAGVDPWRLCLSSWQVATYPQWPGLSCGQQSHDTEQTSSIHCDEYALVQVAGFSHIIYGN